MIPGSELLAFLTAAVLLTLAPGPDILFVIAQGAGNGRRAALLVALGLCTGILVHTAAVTFGLAALFRGSPLAFDLLKYLGAAYLLYLAWRAWCGFRQRVAEDDTVSPAVTRLYRRGLLMNLLNPKVSLFFLAFLPQFVDPARGPVWAQLLILGLVFFLQGLVIMSGAGMLAGSITAGLRRHPDGPRWLSLASALLFAGLALRLLGTSNNL